MATLDISTMVPDGCIILKVTIRFLRAVLGCSPSPDVLREHTGKQAIEQGVPPEQIEREAAEFEAEFAHLTPDERKNLYKKAGTFFYRSGGRLYLKDHQILGFFKNAGDVMRTGVEAPVEAAPETDAPKGAKRRGTEWGTIRGKVDRCLFVADEKNFFYRLGPGGQREFVLKADDFLTRPVRVNGPSGPRVGIVSSEMLLAEPDLFCDFTLRLMPSNQVSVDQVARMLKYGQDRGLLQWRNAGYGAFTGKMTLPDGTPCKFLP